MTNLAPRRWRSLKAALVSCAVIAVASQSGRLSAQQGEGRRGAPGAPAGQAEARGRGPAMGSFDPVLVGAIDIQVFPGPDNRGRSLDFLDAVRYAKLKGLRGLVLQGNFDPTAAYAFVARKEVPGIEVFGSIALNRSVGGLNAAAVEHFVEVTMPGAPPQGYGRIVMFPSAESRYELEVRKRPGPSVIAVQNGEVVAEGKTILGLIKKFNLSMSTGMQSPDECVILVREAIKQGIAPTRITVTHANMDTPGLDVAHMQEVAKLGAFIEFSSQTQRAFTPEAQKALDARNDQEADMIKKVGPEFFIMSTELGQANNEYAPDGLAAYVRNMRARGLTAADTDMMTKRNPARFLGLPETPVPATR